MLGALLAVGGVLLTLNRRWDGLWHVLDGWFLAGTAAGEQRHAALAEGVEGLRAHDAMTPSPVLAAGGACGIADQEPPDPQTWARGLRTPGDPR